MKKINKLKTKNSKIKFIQILSLLAITILILVGLIITGVYFMTR